MNVIPHDCGWGHPHAAHPMLVVHPVTPSWVTVLSCRGVPVGDANPVDAAPDADAKPRDGAP